jgi:spore maturation protein CgeB
LSLVFDVGREIATYRDVDQCAEVIRRILAHPADADRMRRAARTRSLRDHTYTARWSTVLQMLGAVENQPRP